MCWQVVAVVGIILFRIHHAWLLVLLAGSQLGPVGSSWSAAPCEGQPPGLLWPSNRLHADTRAPATIQTTEYEAFTWVLEI